MIITKEKNEACYFCHKIPSFAQYFAIDHIDKRKNEVVKTTVHAVCDICSPLLFESFEKDKEKG